MPHSHIRNKEVTKGVGRFGPFIKWDGMFINVSKKYDFDNLSKQDIEEIIEAKKQKEIDQLVQRMARGRYSNRKGEMGKAYHY